MNEHPAFLVYSHLGRFLKNRKLTPSAPLDIDRVRFVTELKIIEYSKVVATTSDGQTTVILLLGEDSQYAWQGPKLRKLISSVSSEAYAVAGLLTEVIIIAPEPVLGKKNMTDVVISFQKAAASGLSLAKGGSGADRRVSAKFYNMYAYHTFSLDIPNAQCVPRHTIMEVEEVEELLKRERITREDLQRVAASNSPVVWIGARPGQVVAVESPSETAGISLKYCLVCP